MSVKPLTADELEMLSLDSIRNYLHTMSDKDLADLLRSPAMDYKSINVTAKAEALARLLEKPEPEDDKIIFTLGDLKEE